MDAVSSKTLYELFKHGYSWLSNLRRAKKDRKQESIKALRTVIKASRETAVYMRQLSDNGKRDHKTERDLAVLWTDLGFALEDIGLTKLAKRCQIKGKHWSDPSHYDDEFLEKADVNLDRMEKIASELLKDIRKS